MASLSVRKLDDQVYNQLQARAITHGVSMEEEVRCILTQAVLTPQKLSEIFKENFGPKKGVDLFLSQQEAHEPLEFES